MFIYMPNQYASRRVTWHEDTPLSLCYQKESTDKYGNQLWLTRKIRAMQNGMPQGMSDLHAEMKDFYDFCVTMESDCLCGTI